MSTEKDITMKRSMTYAAIGFGLLLPYLSQPALSQTIPSAQTNAAPAAASLGGLTYVAWKGKSAPADKVWYADSNTWGQNSISFAVTTQAPALTTFGSTLYLAWRGQGTGPTDEIYYSTSTGAGWSSQTTVCNPGKTTCAEAAAAPALAASSSTLYAAWTTSTNTIEYAAFNGTWACPSAQPPAIAVPGTAPALAVFDNTLYLAWVAQGTSEVEYATMSLSSGAWSSAASTGISTSVAPALGVYTVPTGDTGESLPSGLYMAVASGGTLSVYDWDDGWVAVRIPGLPIPPGPFTPALVNTATICEPSGSEASTSALSLVYSYPDPGTSFDEIYVEQLSYGTGKCIIPCTPCPPASCCA